MPTPHSVTYLSAPSAPYAPSATSASSAPSASSGPSASAGSPHTGSYPGLAEYMGLELTEAEVRANMPEYLPAVVQVHKPLY